MPTTINASNTSGGAVVTGDGSGILELQSGGVTGITVNGANVTVAGNANIGGNAVITGTLTATGGVPVSELTGTLPVANGGTGAATLPANNVLIGNGTSAVATVAPGTSGNVLTSDGTTWASTALPPSGTLQAIASGSLADGSTVIVNADGTVSAVGGVSINPPTVTTPVVFETGSTSLITAIYDGSAKKPIIVYSRPSTSNFGGSIVGTISGGTISFPSSSVQFGPGSVSNGVSAVYDKNANKFVVFYRDGNNNSILTAQVGTVSGTTISYGASVVFGDLNDQNPRSVAYDEASGKIVFPYRKGSGAGGVRIGTVSGTSISFGAEVIFSGSSANEISAVYDASSQKVVIAYQGASNFGTAIVGTVSGTSISFGTPVVFESESTNQIFAVYDENAQKIVIAYRDAGNSNFGTAIVGTVSGTSISFGTPVVFESASTSNISATYDENALRVVIAYTDVGNSSRGTVSLLINANSNLTTENFIGFSNASYTDGQAATIQIVGAVDDAQSGLTPGQSYFVQNEGQLSLTPASPSVFAGTAVSATKIIVKG